MIRTLIDFAPTELALAPRPLEGELTSSWLYRVAAANLVELEELLSGLLHQYLPGLRRCPGLEPSVGNIVPVSRVAGPETRSDASVPGQGPELVCTRKRCTQKRTELGKWVRVVAGIHILPPMSAPAGQKWPAGTPTCRMDPGVLTHCPQHQDEPLRHYCLCCHREEPRWIVTREGEDEEVQCWHCGTALHHWPRENIERFSPSLQLTLRLESTLLRSLSGQAPDPFWVGNVDAETFANLAAELFALLAEPDRKGVLSLADHLGDADWWDEHRLGYGVVTTVASLQHWASRLKVVASVAKCLLGERSLQFFRFRGPRCVGQRELFPFAIFASRTPCGAPWGVDSARHALAEQVARVAG